MNLRKIRKISKLGIDFPLLPSRNKSLARMIKNYAKADIRVFRSCPILYDFFTLFQSSCPALYLILGD